MSVHRLYDRAVAFSFSSSKRKQFNRELPQATRHRQGTPQTEPFLPTVLLPEMGR